MIVDHLGMRQNPTFGLDDPPFRDLPALLALAELPNVRVKVSGVPTLSAGPYPFADLWASLDQVLAAFGAERLMWGSDISRVMGRAGTIRLAPEGREYAKHTYAEALFYLKHTDRLTADQREWATVAARPHGRDGARLGVAPTRRASRRRRCGCRRDRAA